MENILFKKSYLHKSLKQISYDELWNKKGIFTTIRVLGKPIKFLHLEQHINNFNRSLAVLSIDYKINKVMLYSFINNFFKKKIYYNHLFRIAANNKIVSFSLRKNKKNNENFRGILITYQRPNYKLKNLKYKKIFSLLKNVNTQNTEIILTKNNIVFEGCTTNILCVKNNKVYMPQHGYYVGTTLKFFLKNYNKKIIKTIITKKSLKKFDEILLVGSGKGVVAVDKIPQIHWYKRKSTVYNEFYKIYKLYIKQEIAT